MSYKETNTHTHTRFLKFMQNNFKRNFKLKCSWDLQQIDDLFSASNFTLDSSKVRVDLRHGLWDLVCHGFLNHALFFASEYFYFLGFLQTLPRCFRILFFIKKIRNYWIMTNHDIFVFLSIRVYCLQQAWTRDANKCFRLLILQAHFWVLHVDVIFV